MTDQKVTVENLLQIEGFLKQWSGVTLRKISWCLARNAVIVEDALKTLRDETAATDEMTKLQAAIREHRTKKFGPSKLNPAQIDELNADIEAMKLEDEWKKAAEDEAKVEERFKILVKEDSGVNLYKIKSDDFEKYNIGKDETPVIPTAAIAFMIRHGIITLDDDEDSPTVNTPQVDAEA